MAAPNSPVSTTTRPAAETAIPTTTPAIPTAATTSSQSRLPLRGWSLELARRWNSGTYSLFVVHGNIFDLFPVQDGTDVHYVPLKTFLVRRLFPERACLLFYDISDGLTFGSADMQKRFFEWLEIYDSVHFGRHAARENRAELTRGSRGGASARRSGCCRACAPWPW